VIGVHGRIYAGMLSGLIWTKFVPKMGLWHLFWGCLQTETNTSVPSNIHIQTCSKYIHLLFHKLMKQKKCYEKTKCLTLKYPHGFVCQNCSSNCTIAQLSSKVASQECTHGFFCTLSKVWFPISAPHMIFCSSKVWPFIPRWYCGLESKFYFSLPMWIADSSRNQEHVSNFGLNLTIENQHLHWYQHKIFY